MNYSFSINVQAGNSPVQYLSYDGCQAGNTPLDVIMKILAKEFMIHSSFCQIEIKMIDNQTFEADVTLSDTNFQMTNFDRKNINTGASVIMCCITILIALLVMLLALV